MTRKFGFMILCSTVTMFGPACATKSFVEEQLNATESRVTQLVNATETLLASRADTQERTVRETVDDARASRQAIDEVGALASDAKTRADLAAVAARDAEARLSQRLADRNKYKLLETRFIFFASDRAELRPEDIKELEDVAKALKADANAVLELQGFADPRGSDRYNNELARERVEAVIRHLVRRHDIELRQLRAIAMGKEPLAAGEKPGTEAFAKARRVDIRVLAPWSSSEDRQTQNDSSNDAGAASPPTSIEVDRPATPKIAPRDVLGQDAPGTWVEIMKTVSPRDLGSKD